MPEGGPGTYGDSVADDTNGWVEVNTGDFLPARSDGTMPFRVFANRFKSSSGLSEFFLHDPLRQMLRDPGALSGLRDWPAYPGDPDPDGNDTSEMEEIRKDSRFHVTTFLTNHHRKLSRIHASVIAIVAPDGIHLMIYKDADQGGV
jgi:hypothetical protein